MNHDRVFITRIPNPIQDTSVPPRLPVNPSVISHDIITPRIGVAEVGVPYVEPVDVAPPPMRHARPVETVLRSHSSMSVPPSDVVIVSCEQRHLPPDERVHSVRLPNVVDDTSVPPRLSVNPSVVSHRIGAPRIGVAEVGVPYVEPVDVAPAPMFHMPLVQSSVFTPFVASPSPPAVAVVGESEVTMNGVFPCITYGGINPIYAPFGVIAGLSTEIANLSNEITNISNEIVVINSNITTLSSELNNLSGYVYANPVSNWSTYPAVSTLDMNNNSITNISSLQIDAQILTADASDLFLNGIAVATVTDISNVADWSLFPAISDVQMNTHNIISEISGQGQFGIASWNSLEIIGGLSGGTTTISGFLPVPLKGDVFIQSGFNKDGEITLKSGLLGNSNVKVRGYIDQTSVGGGTAISNYFDSAVQVGAGSGFLGVDGINQTAGSSALFVSGGTTLDGGGIVHGITIGTVPVAGINTQRIDVLPVGILLTTPTFITMNGLGAANIAMGGAVAIAAGSYVTLEHGFGAGQNGVFVQNTNRDVNARLVFTGGGTLFNATNVQASNIVNPLGVRFYNGVYNPSGGSVIVPPIYGRAIVDLSTTSSYFATLTGGDLPATKNSNSVFIGNLTNLSTGGAFSTIAIGDISGMTGQGDNSVAIGSGAGRTNQTSNSVAIGALAGQETQGDNCVAIGFTAGLSGQSSSCVAIGSETATLNQGFQSVAIGKFAGSSNQSSNSVAVGSGAGSQGQGINSVAIGNTAGQSNQATGCVAVGQAGVTSQGLNSVAIGLFAGNNTQGASAVAIGDNAGQVLQGANAIAIGANCGYTSQGVGSIAIGDSTGFTFIGDYSIAMGKNCDVVESNAIILNATGSTLNATTSGSVFVAPMRNVDESGFQVLARNAVTGEIIQTLVDASTGFVESDWALYPAVANVNVSGFDITNVSQGTFQSIVLNSTEIALGLSAGITGQGGNAIAIGSSAGGVSQVSKAIAIGFEAGYSNQASNCVAIGNTAGFNGQLADAVAIGAFAGNSIQGLHSVAIGGGAGASGQGQDSIAIGYATANVSQGSNAVAIGLNAGQSNQSSNSIAIGFSAGQTDQSDNAVAIGANAGGITQGSRGVAIGLFSGNQLQGIRAVAVGVGSGFSNQGADSVAIGRASGNSFLGSNSVAIGNSASIVGGSFSNTIVVSATGAALNPSQANSCYIAPMRDVQDSNAYQNSLMTYNTTTKEVGYASSAYSIQVVATSGTAIALNPTLRGKTFILTGTTTQAFSTTALGANDTGFFVVAHNGNGVNGGDVNLTGMTGTNVLHERTNQRNNGTAYLYWNGTGLVGY